jgi:hypothetical protein
MDATTRAFMQLISKFKEAASNAPPVAGPARSGQYLAPGNFHNHKSGKFSGNRRRELKLSARKRGKK